VLRLGTSEKSLTEIMAVAEHVNSMAAMAEGFRLRTDVPRPPGGPATEVVAPLDVGDPGFSNETLDHIRAWATSTLGIEHVPAFWRVLARQPRFLTATWAKNSYLKPWVQRSAGVDDGGLVELGAAVMHYVSFNTVAHGMLLDPPFVDVRAEDFRPGGRHANTPGPGAPQPPTS